MDDRGPDPRSRLIFAGALALGLVVAVAVVALGSGGDSVDVEPADPECVSAWNADEKAVTLGIHLFGGHGYESVEVLRLDAEGEPPSTPGEGNCVVVFASPTLDAELIAAAQYFTGKTWRPLSELPGRGGLPAVSSEGLGELQSEAVSKSNASIGGDGRLTARES
jgi:hypothetical protein